MLHADIHRLGVALTVCQNDCKAFSAVFLVTLHSPADHIRIVQIVVLCAVYAVTAKIHHQVDLLVERGAVLGLDTIIVAVEYAGVSLRPQQDRRVRKRHEPGLDRALKRLAGLGVVVVDKCDRVHRIPFYQCVLQKLTHVEFAVAVAGLEEVVVKRNVKQGHTSVAVPQVFFEDAHFRIPVLTDCEKLLMVVGTKVMQPFREEIPCNVLDSVQSETMYVCGIQIPLAPAGQLFSDLGNVIVDVGAHQVVVVDVFAVNAAIPLYAFELIDRDFFFVLVVIDAVKTGVVPDEIRVHAISSRECEFGPRVDHLGSGDRLRAVLVIGFHDLHRLGLISAHAVVKNNVRVDINTASL